ncbi:MAG: hypothetical protein EHM44_02925 [Ignavibacteriales bacterium]|nr:MAG: hypothetical protein EHM44_02925 [Ignavibacteriales bacterium]
MKLLSFVIISFLFLQSCDDTLTNENVDNKPIPATNVSFAEHIYPVFQVKCAFSGCHAQPNPSDGIDLSTWSGVTTDPNIVFPFEPDLSRLVWAIEGRAGISPMPVVGYTRPLTINQIQGIKTWIDEGALDN